MDVDVHFPSLDGCNEFRNGTAATLIWCLGVEVGTGQRSAARNIPIHTTRYLTSQECDDGRRHGFAVEMRTEVAVYARAFCSKHFKHEAEFAFIRVSHELCRTVRAGRLYRVRLRQGSGEDAELCWIGSCTCYAGCTSWR